MYEQMKNDGAVVDKPALAATITGSLSILCWVVVFTPQLYANYKNKTGKSLSLTFLWIWLVGDFFNIVGLILEGLLPTMLALAIYYTIADILLIVQVFYYKRRTSPIFNDEERPLITHGENYLSRVFEVPIQVQYAPQLIIASLSIIVIFFFSYIAVIALGWAQYMGWMSAILYIGSRMPQIAKNHRKQSVEGLSLAMFVFTLLGNSLYVASIFLQSTNYHYLMANLPWLIGSGGTLILDLIITSQCFVYREF